VCWADVSDLGAVHYQLAVHHRIIIIILIVMNGLHVKGMRTTKGQRQLVRVFHTIDRRGSSSFARNMLVAPAQDQGHDDDQAQDASRYYDSVCSRPAVTLATLRVRRCDIDWSTDNSSCSTTDHGWLQARHVAGRVAGCGKLTECIALCRLCGRLSAGDQAGLVGSSSRAVVIVGRPASMTNWNQRRKIG
jgi:hypothetical protein